MNINLDTTIKIAGVVMVVTSIAMLPSFFVSLIYNEIDIASMFITIVFFLLFAGIILMRTPRFTVNKLNVRDGYYILVLIMLVATVVGSLPFYCSNTLTSPVDSFFESCSGFTTTGASVIENVEILPRGILFWRSFTQWIGGLGILLFSIAFMPSLGLNCQNMVTSENPSPMLDKIDDKMISTAKKILVVYLIITTLEIILLLLSGLGVFDSFIHTFGTVGSGGFSNYNNSIAHFDSSLVRIIITCFMVVSGINFNLFFLPIRRGIRVILYDMEIQRYLGIILFGVFFIFTVLVLTDGYDMSKSTLIDALFQVTSFITTTGYTTSNYENWPSTCIMLLVFLMFVGGCSSSTSGGLKVIRTTIVLRLIKRGISTRLHPHIYKTLRISGRSIPRDTISGVVSHVFLYILLLFIGTFLISFENLDLSSCFTSIIACLSNIGIGFSDVGIDKNFGFMSNFSKLVLTLFMIGGRLEGYTLFVLFTPYTWIRRG